MLEQLGATFGTFAGGAMVASVVTPLVAVVTGSVHMQSKLAPIVAVGGLGSLALLCAAAYFKGLAKQMDDDAAASLAMREDRA